MMMFNFNEEQLAEMNATLAGNGASEEAEGSVQDVPTPSKDTQDVKQGATKVAAQPVNAETSDSHEDEDDGAPGQRIPYNRFKRVNEERRQYQQELKKLQQELAQLRQAPTTNHAAPTQQSPKGDTSWLDELFNDGNSSAHAGDPKITALESRIHQFEVAQATQSLQSELASVQQTYPDVPREVLLQAVAQDSSANLTDVAEAYTAWADRVYEQRAKAKGQGAPGKQPAPRAKAVSAGGGRNNPSGEAPPRNLNDAYEKAVQFLRNTPS